MKPIKMRLINTSIGAFICILYRYEERLFQEMCALCINIERDIHYHNIINRLCKKVSLCY